MELDRALVFARFRFLRRSRFVLAATSIFFRSDCLGVALPLYLSGVVVAGWVWAAGMTVLPIKVVSDEFCDFFFVEGVEDFESSGCGQGDHGVHGRVWR